MCIKSWGEVMMKKWGHILAILVMVANLIIHANGGKQGFISRRSLKARQKREIWKQLREARSHRPWHRNREPSNHRITHMLGNLGKDVLLIHKNIFSWDSYKILLLTFPFFIGTRMIDEKLHRIFHDQTCHKNINQLPKWCRELARLSITVPIALLGSQAFLSRDEEFRTTSQVFLLGIPFVLLTKDLIKKFRFEANFRPWHEDFSSEERSGGGFPSGHVAEATYTAVTYGMRYGPKFALPLGALTVFIGVTFLTCNRHYLSQLIAGAGFGAMYAVAANKLIDSKLNTHKDLNINFGINEHGGPTLSLSYHF